ncbi:MAG: UDP-N-acetylmuramoyl-L-alanyl-D-glutamate--2,6-diaminopimelate ligase [Candidatus Sumerlaeia bacterium]|nr:UDP-N-acetylmuramoyl-L-alanyl-D-glutamate--2,6-diaminopimelate ligase [Candidatus Sumerlaeia bacterium]
MLRTDPITLVKLLSDAGVRDAELRGAPGALLTGLADHAERVEPGACFVAQRGANSDSHHFVGRAVERGAAAVIASEPVPVPDGVALALVRDSRRALGHIAQAAAGNPAKALAVLGVTGTNGKTTVAWLTESILADAGISAGRIGTLGYAFAGSEHSLNNTTPGPIELADIMRRMRAAGVTHLAMEVSSHAIDQGRVNGVPFLAGALTSIGQDHLDYHGTFENYVACKKRFFTEHLGPSRGVWVLNLDEAAGEELRDAAGGAPVSTYALGTRASATIQSGDVHTTASFSEFILRIRCEVGRVRAPLVGSFNISNMMAAAGLCDAAGLDVRSIARGLCGCRPAPGRFERVDAGQPFTVLVDYAHTPDALERTLRAARRLASSRLLCVMGAGGNRDAGKRPLMGRACAQLADYTVVTSDNPRFEDPEAIIAQILAGFREERTPRSRYTAITDRRLAIESALRMAAPGDCVLIAGKGHEDYQEVAGVRHPFDDRVAARGALAAMAADWAQGRSPVESASIETHTEGATWN